VSSEIEKKSVKPSGVAAEAGLIVAFVNTLDIEEGTDAIADAGALTAWTATHVPELDRSAADPAGHRRLLDLREALRELLRANNGGDASDGALAALREAAARSGYRTLLGESGKLTIEPAGEGPDALQARLLLAAERLQAAGEWSRLKACPAGDCEWAFHDTSRNRSRTWCSMEECGNRDKTRRYRARRR
jgi:predicted RNA-binding Zn ribbon-like protein